MSDVHIHNVFYKTLLKNNKRKFIEILMDLMAIIGTVLILMQTIMASVVGNVLGFIGGMFSGRWEPIEHH